MNGGRGSHGLFVEGTKDKVKRAPVILVGEKKYNLGACGAN